MRTSKLSRSLVAAAIVSTLSLGAAHSATVRIANQGDALSMDPHSLNESLQLSVTGNVYEPLVGRNKDLSLAPILATSWKQTSPTVWRFELRKNVQFHDGTPFTADDVLFSFARAGGEGSCMLHNSRYDFNDDILPLGAALHASLIEQSMPLA